VGAAGATITLGSAPDTVNAFPINELVTFGSGNATVYGGVGDTIGTSAGTAVVLNAGNSPITVTQTNGAVLINSGAGDTLTGGAAAAQFIGAVNNVITLGSGPDTVNATAGSQTVTLGSGNGTVYGGAGDTVGAGTGTGFINLLSAANALLLDQTGVYADTIANFSQPNGDRIHLTTDTVSNALAHSQQVNGGADTLITLSDNSTILLKGVSGINSSFFS
jgi:Ca2+-binding RTX toxin-like protein